MPKEIPYEKSLVIIKPDAIRRRLAGQVLQRFENAGIKIHAMKMVHASQEKAEAHYEEHRSKDFFLDAVKFMASSPMIIMVLGGFNGIEKIRSIAGSTCPSKAAPGTIRGDFSHAPVGGFYTACNLVHASSSVADAEREIALWFSGETLLEYDACDEFYHGHSVFTS